MKKVFIQISLIFSIFLFSCSTPEERATVVDGGDSATTETAPKNAPVQNNPSTDSAPSNNSENQKVGDSSKSTNTKKMTDFKHTPIDTNQKK